MICCAAIAALFGLFALPFAHTSARGPLAWRPGSDTGQPHGRSIIRSFGYAIEGIGLLIREERNARIHLVGAVGGILAGVVLRISLADWRWIIIAIGLVFASEALNTAIERLCDLASPAIHPLAKATKDVAAGAVLLLAATALLIGFTTFAPYLVRSNEAAPAVPFCGHAPQHDPGLGN